MKLRKCLLVNNDCYIAGKTIVPKGIMVHSTGASNPTLRRYVQPDDGQLGVNTNGNSWNRGGVGACVHAFIGKLKDGTVATYQTLPWTLRGWHAGGAANGTHIGFEICEDSLTDAAYFNEVYREAAELCAYLCGLYGLNPMTDGVLIDHSEGYKRGIASNHGDVGHWFARFGKTMDDFRKTVAQELKPPAQLPQQEAGSVPEKETAQLPQQEAAQAAGNVPEQETAQLPQQEAAQAAGSVPEKPAVRYRLLSEVSGYYRPTIEKLLGRRLFAGKGGSGESLLVDLSEDACRVLTVLDRAGLFGA